MNIIFFGEDIFSLLVLDSLIKNNHKILSVFCPIYSNQIYTKLSLFCTKNDIPFERIENFNNIIFINRLKELKPDLNVVCHFQKLLPIDIVNIPKFGSINLHPSLLPKYRGMAPQHWPIINGESETGITVHFIDDGIDTGDIIIQHKIDISQTETVFELQNKFKPLYSQIMVDAIHRIESNSIQYKKQKHLTGSYYGKLKKSNCFINKSGRCIDAFNLIRATTLPYFGARFDDYIIWKADIVKISNEELDKIEIGKLCKIGEKHYIKFVDGILEIIKFNKNEK